MYTLRTASRDVIYYEIDASAFVVHIKSIGNYHNIDRWQKREDQTMINKLASSLYNSFQGMNIDGCSNAMHTARESSMNKASSSTRIYAAALKKHNKKPNNNSQANVKLLGQRS